MKTSSLIAQNTDADYRQFDNEWVRFINQLSKNETLKKIAYFASGCKFTSRAKRKIISYSYALLGRNLSVTYVRNEHDRNILYCDKSVIDAVLKLGMTNFDVTPEFEMICNQIAFQFSVMVMQSTGGFERRAINTQERRTSHEENYPQIKQEGGLISGVRKMIGGNPPQEEMI